MKQTVIPNIIIQSISIVAVNKIYTVGRTNNRRPAAPTLWPQLAYCFDISHVSRDALAMPLPGTLFRLYEGSNI